MAYATAAEVKAYSGLSEIAALTDDDLNTKYIPRAERIINSYTRQNFNRSPLKVVTVDGSGGNRLELPERLISLSQLRFIDGGAHTAQANGVHTQGFTVASHFSISDDTKIEITGGQANLITDPLDTKVYPFTTPANYTHGGDVEVTGGVARLVFTAFPTDGIFYSPFTLSKDMAWLVGGSNKVGTLFGGASIAAQKLLAQGSDNRGLYYDDAVIGNVGDEFTLRFKYTPNYTTNNVVNTNVISLGPPSGNAGRIVLFNSPSGNNLRITAYNSAGTLIHLANILGGWSPVLGTEYEFELNVDTSIGLIRVFVDGVLIGSTTATVYSRGTTATRCYIGADPSVYSIANGQFDDILMFSTVQHTAGYTPGPNPVESNYVTTDPTIETDEGLSFDRALDVLTAITTTPGSDSVTVIVSSDNGVTYKYWNGAAWVASDESLAQSNTFAVAQTNLPTLASSGTFKLKLILHSADGSTTPEADSVTVSNSLLYPTDDNLYLQTTDAGQICPSNFLSWASIVLSTTLPTGTDIKVMFSVDGRDNWLTWDGTNWTPPADASLRANAVSLADAVANFAQLDAIGCLDLRIFLYSSDLNVTPVISQYVIESLTLSANAIVSSVNIDQIFNKNWYLMADTEPVRARSRIGKQERLEDALIFPLGFENIELTGYFGYSSVPQEVKDAVAEVIERIVLREGAKTVKHGKFKKEKIGDYEYERFTDSDKETQRDSYISNLAKDYLRNYRKPILMARI